MLKRNQQCFHKYYLLFNQKKKGLIFIKPFKFIKYNTLIFHSFVQYPNNFHKNRS